METGPRVHRGRTEADRKGVRGEDMIKWLYIGSVVLSYASAVSTISGSTRYMKEKGYKDESKMGNVEKIAAITQVIIIGLIPVVNLVWVTIKQEDMNERIDKKFLGS